MEAHAKRVDTIRKFQNKREEIAKESETLGRIATAEKYGVSTSAIDSWRRKAGISKSPGYETRGIKRKKIAPIVSYTPSISTAWIDGFREGFREAMMLMKEMKNGD